jgi:hypothetical protein
VALHALAFQRYSAGRRPALISSVTARTEPPPAPVVVTEPDEPKVALAPVAPPVPTMTDDELLDLYKESQFALGHGETPWAVSVQVELEREMCRALKHRCLGSRHAGGHAGRACTSVRSRIRRDRPGWRLRHQGIRAKTIEALAGGSQAKARFPIGYVFCV